MTDRGPVEKPACWYLFCNHWTQGGIGYSFPMGWHAGKRYERTFSTVYTIEKMLDAAEEWPGLVSTMELDAFAYEEVLKEAPETITRLKDALAAGKAGIEGGTYGQPLGQDFGAESNLRQLTYGRGSILETLDYPVHTFLVEEQWFHPQMPQLMLTAGYRYACLQAQNSGQASPMKRDVIAWRGADGSALPTIPANDLQVSCVRQYTDYQAYEQVLASYEDPLVFQWVEVWAPGMDWGASAEPFRRAIDHVAELGGRPTTLQGYFEAILPGRELETVDIALDQSNYANNWYQAGGWGYDGDRVIQLDSQAEHALLHLETLAARTDASDPFDEIDLDGLWRRLMVLQNHDFSCARNYQVWTEDGQLTENGYLAQAGYRRLIADAQAAALKLSPPRPDARVLFNHNDAEGRRVIPDPEGSGDWLQVDLPRFDSTTISDAPRSAPGRFERGQEIGDERFSICWRPGSWDVEIRDSESGTTVNFAGVSGRISKLNEHDANVWPALSPGHETFSFAFDGTVHAPDQVAAGRVTSRVSRSDIRSTLLLECDLLTLHTTDTPVARAEIRVHLDHGAGTVCVETFLYTGVWLALEDCRALFSHNIDEARTYRDYPFGEEEAAIEAVYPLSYTRISGEGSDRDRALQIIHAGSRRAYYHRDAAGGGRVEYLLARNKIRGEYHFGFTLVFGQISPAQAARNARLHTSPLQTVTSAQVEGRAFASFDDDAVTITSISSNRQLTQGRSDKLVSDHGGERFDAEEDSAQLVIRAVNLSGIETRARLRVGGRETAAIGIEATGKTLSSHAAGEDVSFRPWQVRTFAVSSEEVVER